jgi:hypothetical protein
VPKPQWVNLPKATKWVGGDVTSKDRLGAVRYKCTFKKAGRATVKYRLVALDGNVTYTEDEKRRCAHFKPRHEKGTATLNSAGEFVHEIQLPAAGGDRYRIKVTHKTKTKTKTETSPTFATRRMLFYQSITMNGIGEGNLDQMEADFWDENEGYYLKLQREGGNATIPYIEVLQGATAYHRLLRSVKAAYTLQARRPFAFVIVWSNYIAAKAERTIHFPGNLKIPDDGSDYSKTLDFGVARYLWHGFDNAEDVAKHWLKSCTFTFTDSHGRKTKVTIDRAQVKVGGHAAFTHGGYGTVSVELTNDDVARVRGHTLTKASINFRFLAGSTNGFSSARLNLIAVASKATWEDLPDETKAVVLNHEIGHKIGLAANGGGISPDQPPDYYTQRTHAGPHCGAGAAFDAVQSKWSGTPECVMFGAHETADGPSPRTFCDACKVSVRKVHVGAGNEGFLISVDDFLPAYIVPLRHIDRT